VRQGIDQLDDRVSNINRITESVLERNLRQMTSVALVSLPFNQMFSLSQFVCLQEESIRKGSLILNENSKELEAALIDLVQENKALADVMHAHSKSEMLQEVTNRKFSPLAVRIPRK
jgi:hypothetical protein